MNPDVAPKSPEPVKTNLEKQRSMSELATIVFLEDRGVQHLKTFIPGQPVLYVFEQVLLGDDGPFGSLPPESRPNITIVRDPVELDFDSPCYSDKNPERGALYKLKNLGGRADFYVIDPVTEQPLLVGTKFRNKHYHVKWENLFSPDDKLFPPTS